MFQVGAENQTRVLEEQQVLLTAVISPALRQGLLMSLALAWLASELWGPVLGLQKVA